MQAIRPGLIRSLPLLGAGAAGVLVALTCVAVPTTWLEHAAVTSGAAAVLPVAEPPLGATARAVLALGGGLAVAAVVWAALYLLVGPGGPLSLGAKPRTTPRAKPGKAVPTVRRADAHPDAPPRWPLSATELPAPPPPVEQELPADLDVPLAAFDPHAVPPVPMAPVRPVKPLAPELAPGERMETFALKPPARPVVPDPEEKPSIDALLRRLEQGAQRRVAAR